MNKSYDIVIIGSGPGGYVAAIRAAQLSMKVAVIEKKDLGGICLNWGCIPTKALLRTSEIYDYIKNSSHFGIDISQNKLNIKEIVQRSRDVAKKLSRGIDFLFKKNKIDLIYGSAKLNKNKEIVIKKNNEEKIILAKNIIIATGAGPKKIKISKNYDDLNLWNYIDAMTPKQIPKSLGVIGSGAIGIEFASFYNSLGSNVEVFEMQSEILPSEDFEISNFLRKSLSKKGVKFHLNSSVVDIYQKDTFELHYKNLKSNKDLFSNYEKILVAVGIQGNIDNLGLEFTSVKTKNNQIITYDYGKTDEKNIYAIGDVAGAPWLAHKASHEGIHCVEFIAGLRKDNSEKMTIPSCVYSNPQVATIGLSERKAKQMGFNIKVGKFPLSANGKALSLSESEGFVKIIFEKKTGQILGAHLVGVEVTELINSFSLAMKLEATELDIFSTVFPHPTISEAIHESALDAYNKALHI